MRRAGPIIGVAVAVSAAGALIAGAGASLMVALAAGVVVLGAVTLLGFTTAPLAWLAACLFITTIQWNGIRLGGGSFANVFMAGAFGTMAMHALFTRRQVVAPPVLFVCALGWLLATLLALIFPPTLGLNRLTDVNIYLLGLDPVYITHRSDVFTLLQVEASFLITPLVVIAACTTVRRCRTMLDLWTIGAVVSAFVGLTDTLGIIHLAPYPLSSGTRSSGLTIHPNYLALGACMGIPTAMLWIGRSQRWTLAGIAAVVTLLGGAYASGSRAGAVTAIAAVGATALLVPRLRPLAIKAVPFVGMVAVVVLFYTKAGDHILAQVRLGGDTTDLTTTGSNAQRSRAAHAAWEQFKARPVQGVGFSVIQDAHNIYLQLLSATGVIGLLAFLTYVGGIGKAVLRGLQGPLRDEVAACGLIIGTWLINGVVDNQLGDKYLYVIPGAIFAMAHLSRVMAAREAEAAAADAASPHEPAAEPVRVSPAPAPAVV